MPKTVKIDYAKLAEKMEMEFHEALMHHDITLDTLVHFINYMNMNFKNQYILDDLLSGVLTYE